MTLIRSRIRMLWLLGSLGLAVAALPAQSQAAANQTQGLAKFVDQDKNIINVAFATTDDGKRAVFVMVSDSDGHSAAFFSTKDKLNSFISIWEKAKTAAASADGQDIDEGSVDDGDTELDLKVSTRGIMFTNNSKDGTNIAVLSPKDYAGFERAIKDGAARLGTR